jgi:integrase
MPRKRLTDQFVERLKPPAKGRVSYFDASFPGLELQHTAFDRRTWYLLFRMQGDPKLRRVKLGVYPHINPAKARVLATEALDKVHAGTDPSAERKRAREAAPDIGSIDALVRDYLAQHVAKNCARGTYYTNERILRVDVLKPWRGRTLDSITKRDAIALVDRIAERGAPVHSNRVLSQLRAMFNWAVSKDRVAASPITGVEDPTREKARERWLDDREIVWFWQACERIGYPFGPLFQVLLLTGQRRTETSQMEWSELDLDAALWTIPANKAKSGRSHQVQLAPQVIEILRSLPKLGPFVFSGSRGRGVTGYTVGKRRLDAAMKQVSDGAKVAPFILHDLRRTAASHMAKIGIAPHVVDKILAHSGGTIRGIARIYNRFEYENERRSALVAWANYVTSLVAPEISNVVSMHGR